MERSDRGVPQPVQTHCALPVFGLWRAPVFPPATSEDRPQTGQGHDVEERAPRSLVHPLHAALLSTQDKIKKLTNENDSLRRENARLTLKELGSPEDMQELSRLYTQAKTEKEEMETRMKKMEEAFRRERKTWEEMSRQQLGERLGDRSSLRVKLLVAQTHINQMEEEVRESRRGIQEGRGQLEREITSLRKENAVMEDHWREVIRDTEEDAATKLRVSEEKWQRRVSQLEEEIQEKRSFVSSLIDKMLALREEHRHTVTLLSQSEKKWERKCNVLEESLRKELAEKEESWQKRVQEMERKSELEMWLQTEEEWRQKTSALEEEIKRLIKENTQLQKLAGKKKKRRQWWRRHCRLRRTQRSTGSMSGETTVPPAQATEE